METIRIKKIHGIARIPSQAHPTDAGFDLHSAEDKLVKMGSIELVKTGIQIKLPEGYEAQIRSRSGLSLKHGIVVLNSPGTIDENYTGEMGIIIANFGKDDYMVSAGDRIAQIVFKKVDPVCLVEVDSIEETDRGSKGFGSSGK